MSTMASQITGVPIVCSNVCSGTGQRKHQSSLSLAFVRGVHWWPVDSPHPVKRKLFLFDDVIMMDIPSKDERRMWQSHSCKFLESLSVVKFNLGRHKQVVLNWWFHVVSPISLKTGRHRDANLVVTDCMDGCHDDSTIGLVTMKLTSWRFSVFSSLTSATASPWTRHRSNSSCPIVIMVMLSGMGRSGYSLLISMSLLQTFTCWIMWRNINVCGMSWEAFHWI